MLAESNENFMGMDTRTFCDVVYARVSLHQTNFPAGWRCDRELVALGVLSMCFSAWVF